MYHGLGSYLCRVVALADFLDTVRRLVWLLNEMCHPDDFVFLVIFDHFGLLDDRHEILGMADLALESAPDLRNILLAHVILLNITLWQRTRLATYQKR
jgi:hypothetical protein